MSDPITLIKAKLQLLRTEQEACESDISSLLEEKAAIQQVILIKIKLIKNITTNNILFRFYQKLFKSLCPREIL